MPEQWIVRVAGKDYGPVELETLREWKAEGRVLSVNEVRQPGDQTWGIARDIPGLFEPPPISRLVQVPSSEAGRGFWQICLETVRVYRRGFFQFFGLSLLVIIPSILVQLTGLFLNQSEGVSPDLRAALARGFGFCMFLLRLAALPIFVAGIQILTAEIVAMRRPRFFALLNDVLKHWPRVAALCLLVNGVWMLLTALLFAALLMMVFGASSLVAILLALGLAALQVWMFGKWFINVLFWQQVVVFEGRNVTDTLRESAALARSRSDLPWFKRPLWRGVFIASLWTLFLLALSIPAAWPVMREGFQMINTGQDPQKMLDALSTVQAAAEADRLNFALWLVEKFAQPLLGIAFVLIYFDAKTGDSGQGTGES
jgi:hypothetical protein